MPSSSYYSRGSQPDAVGPLRATQGNEERWWRKLQLAASASAGGRAANFGRELKLVHRCLSYMRKETGAFCLAFLFIIQAQSPDSESVKLTVRTKGDQTIFHIGELIPLELSFTSASENHYQINTASYDRSGRLGVESYQVEPSTGWDDPLALYFRSYGGTIGGGLSGFQKLSEQPAVIHRALNEWVRFNQSGRYHVAVTSSRVSRVGAEFLSKPKEVPSDGLWLTIIPATPEWQAATLAEAL